MEFTIVEDKKNKMIFELKGETHTFCNILKEELLQDKNVKIASYDLTHPLVGVPRFLLETKGIETKKALLDAAKRVGARADNFKEIFNKKA